MRNQKETADFIKQRIENEQASYNTIANDLGCTGERVRQILKRYYPEFIEQRKKERVYFCPTCNVQVLNRSKNYFYCIDCWNEHIKEKENRWSKIADACRLCSTIKTPHGGNGLCKNCYIKNIYHTSEKRRTNQKNLTNQWRKKNKKRWSEISMKAAKKYNLKHKTVNQGMLIEKEVWQELRERKKQTGLTWNLFIKQLLEN